MNVTFSSAALHRRARAFVHAFETGGAGAEMPEPFDALAVDLARYQAAKVPGYSRLVTARGLVPARFTRAGDAPAVPTDVFKMARVATFSPEEAAPGATSSRVFRTSGTTIGERGEHSFLDVGSYDAAALAFGRVSLAADLVPAGAGDVSARFPIVVLGPSPEEATDSSLAHMNGLFVREMGLPAPPDRTYFVQNDILDVAGLDERIASLIVNGAEAVLVLATSFALVHLLEALEDAPFRLPAKSRVMQTGGFKGKSREVDAATLRREVAAAFCLDERQVVGEYGMTELSSQFYERTAVDPSAPRDVYFEPPWARVVPVDPETLEPVADGEVGIARIEDLMNVDSAFAVLAADRVRRRDGGFELLGRAPGATPRGCSIAIDEMLSGARA